MSGYYASICMLLCDSCIILGSVRLILCHICVIIMQVFFPILHSGHYFVVCINFKNSVIQVLNNLTEDFRLYGELEGQIVSNTLNIPFACVLVVERINLSSLHMCIFSSRASFSGNILRISGTRKWQIS